MLRAAEMAKAAMPKATVINMIQLPGARRAERVILQVRFAEAES